MTLFNRTVLITGPSSAVGQALIPELARQGANLVLVERNPDKLPGLEIPPERLLVQAADLLQADQIQAAVQAALAKFGALHGLIHLVGGWTGGQTVAEMGADTLETMLNQHLWTTLHALQACGPHLVHSGWGRIVLISSPSAVQPKAKGGAYAAGKAAQDALVLTMAQELKGSGVTANLLQVKTIDAQREKVSQPKPENAGWTTPEELVSAVLFLLSDEGGAVNGARIPLFGG